MKSLHHRAAEEAIKKMMDTMDGHGLEALKGLKGKPVAEMSITKVSPVKKEDGPWDDAAEEARESPDEEKYESEHGEENEPTDEDKMKIAEMYRKYCKGM